MSLVDLLKLLYSHNKKFRKTVCQISKTTYEAYFITAKVKKQKTESCEGTEMQIIIQRFFFFQSTI